MALVANVTTAVQGLIGRWAEEAAQESGVIQRERKFSPASLAQCFVFGFLAKPQASDEELAQRAGVCGVEVTPQAVEQRHTPRLVAFLEGLFRRAMGQVVGAEGALAPLLKRFTQPVPLNC